MSTSAPDWAVDEAVKRLNKRAEVNAAGQYPPLRLARDDLLVQVLAEHIARHETEPVEPLVLEARRVIAGHHGITTPIGRRHQLNVHRRLEAIAGGKGDHYWEMRVVMAALARGREMILDAVAPQAPASVKAWLTAAEAQERYGER